MTNTTLSNSFFLNDKLKENIFNSISSNSINSFIISGPKGLGKTNFIINLSKFILCELENENLLNLSKLKQSKNTFDNIIKNKSFYLFDNGSHPDFFHLKNKIENLGKKIPIEDVRKLKSFFHKTVSVSKTKIAVIDKIEDLSINSLNSLLKTIEELPKKSYIFIISNKPLNIIETIKSRCALFYINSLNEIDFNYFIKTNYSTVSFEENIFLSSISNGSPGLAKELMDNKIYSVYDNFLDDIIDYDSSTLFLEKINNLFLVNEKNNAFLFSSFQLIINDLIKKSTFYLNTKNFFDFTLTKEKTLIKLILNHNNGLKLLKLHSKFDKYMNSADLVNLNKSEIIIDTLKDLFGK